MEFSDSELEAYLDESLDPSVAAELERQIRDNEDLLRRLAEVNSRRDAGYHSIGEIWRQQQIGVPSGQEIRSYILGVCEPDEADYIRFRIEVLKCPITIACWKDLQQQGASAKSTDNATETRRKKYFDSSAGLLRSQQPPSQ